jgi:hypothetical protein
MPGETVESAAATGEALDRSRYQIDFDDHFIRFNPDHWLPYYLPHWASREHTRARYEVGEGLTLRIDDDQAPWAPEHDGPLRVTNLQTGSRSGPVGSGDGQLRFRDGLVVSEQQPTERLYTPSSGLIEVRASALADANCMVALWLIGFEETPDASGEICVMEIVGSEVGSDRASVGMGIHPWHDPALVDDFEKIELRGDATEPHLYSVEWMPGLTRYFIDEREVKRSAQAPEYPMQLMLDVYEFEPGGEYPKRFHVDFVRGWTRID